MKEYLIPTAAAEVEVIEKRSRFIGRIYPVTTEAEAQAHLIALRAEHRAANHNVFAYVVREGNLLRYSDDGEPQGTAGQPTLNVLVKEEVTNVLCTVTRYFGGTLLGAGGLVRAYAQTAKAALDAAGISIVREWQRLTLGCSYPQYERLSKTATDHGAVIEDTNFAADVTLTLLIPAPEAATFRTQMTEATAGTAIITEQDIVEVPVPLKV